MKNCDFCNHRFTSSENTNDRKDHLINCEVKETKRLAAERGLVPSHVRGEVLTMLIEARVEMMRGAIGSRDRTRRSSHLAIIMGVYLPQWVEDVRVRTSRLDDAAIPLIFKRCIDDADFRETVIAAHDITLRASGEDEAQRGRDAVAALVGYERCAHPHHPAVVAEYVEDAQGQRCIQRPCCDNAMKAYAFDLYYEASPTLGRPATQSTSAYSPGADRGWSAKPKVAP